MLKELVLILLGIGASLLGYTIDIVKFGMVVTPKVVLVIANSKNSYMAYIM